MKRIGNRELTVLLITGAATLVAAAAAILVDASPEWKYYQTEFRYILEENVGDIEPSQVPSGIRQIWVEDLDRVDRSGARVLPRPEPQRESGRRRLRSAFRLASRHSERRRR